MTQAQSEFRTTGNGANGGVIHFYDRGVTGSYAFINVTTLAGRQVAKHTSMPIQVRTVQHSSIMVAPPRAPAEQGVRSLVLLRWPAMTRLFAMEP